MRLARLFVRPCVCLFVRLNSKAKTRRETKIGLNALLGAGVNRCICANFLFKRSAVRVRVKDRVWQCNV